VPPTPGPRHHAVLDLTLVLGGWAKAHPELVLGTHEARDPAAWAMRPPDAALWRASDLDDYAGGLKRIPPVLAAWVVDEREALPELRELARWCIAAGARAAWLVEPGPESVEVITAGHEHLFTLDATLPEATGLPGLAPRVRDLVRTASFNAGPRDAP
jgi:hypothetical protein